jgi:tetratricopeptide (TPR) repeat protein
VLGIQSDPRSPERGHYGFQQDLVRHVAYETLSKRERKIRHLGAAAHIETVFVDQDEVVEVLASHYLAAIEAAPEAEDANAIRNKASRMLARAGERAGSLGAPEEGQRYYEQAAALADEPLTEAALHEQAGRLAFKSNRPLQSRERLERALSLYAEMGDERAAARASAALADADLAEGRLQEAVERLELASLALEKDTPSPELASLLAELGRIQAIQGRGDAAAAHLERALTLAELLQLPEVFVEALISKSIIVQLQGRLAEARILLEAAAERALSEQLYASTLRANNNLAYVLEASDHYAETLDLYEQTIRLARRRGDVRWESQLRTASIIDLYLLGRWDEALPIANEQLQAETEIAQGQLLAIALIHCERDDLASARAVMERGEPLRNSSNPQNAAGYGSMEARVLRAEGRPAEALSAAERALARRDELAMTDTEVKRGLIESVEAALDLHDLDKADELLGITEALSPGELTPYLQAHSLRLRARIDAGRGKVDHVDEHFRAATALFREFDLIFHQAVSQLENAEWLTGQDHGDEASGLLAEARTTFERLEAKAWLERLDALEADTATRIPA